MYKITDGNTACADVAYKFSEMSFIYPITPSSPMASEIDELSSKNEENFFNGKTKVVEMQSEGGAAGALHGALLGGTLASTFTASQGLLLMIPNMYKIAGEMLPCVIHVASRSLATHALSIQGDHQDIYAIRQTGFCILASSNVQDAHNLAAVSHLSSIESSLPFLHFFDGFRTSHEYNKIEYLNYEKVKSLINQEKILDFKNRALNVGNDITRGTAQNEDVYFTCTQARNSYYKDVPDIVNNYMEKINEIAGTNYKPFNYYGDSSAENIIIAMGSVTDTIKSVVDNTPNTGLIEVHLYRPFSKEYLEKVLPKTTINIAVLDRTNEAGSIGEPLYLDIVAALKDKNINIVGGRYGLSGKNTTPNDIYDVFKMLETKLKNEFTIGIKDDLLNSNLEHYKYDNKLNCDEIKIYGFGSDGSVGASKDLLKILGTEKYVQGYFEYDSKKSGGVTISHLRFSNNKINAPYYVENPKIVVVTKEKYLNKYDILSDIAESGTLIINTDTEEKVLNNILSNNIKQTIHNKNIKVYTIDANKIASDNNIPGRIGIIVEDIILNKLNVNNYRELMINHIKNKYMKKGQNIVDSNINSLNDIELKEINIDNKLNKEEIKEKNIIEQINCGKGKYLSTTELLSYSTGILKGGNTKYEKRGLSSVIAKWIPENCIECGMCSLVCPHGIIRPIEHETFDIESKFSLRNKQKNYSILISKKDCTGCGVCKSICPGKFGFKAIEMIPFDEEDINNEIFNEYKNENDNKFTIKGSQYEKSLFEFSGACAGCGETPYIKLLTQLFGKELIIANATGCSSIYGGSCPSTPYDVPWANSLFEDNAEFGFGLLTSYNEQRNKIEEIMSKEPENKLYQEWLNNKDNFEITSVIKENLEKNNFDKTLINYIPSRSVWCIGGDGWAYDIGFSGIDQVLSSNEDINILVLDTEVYSNTGGQSSKSTKLGAVAKFQMDGKRTNKKDLFRIATSYDNVYAATICLGANMMQTINAFKEAKHHKGPSIIIAYAPCIEHGIKGGLTNSVNEEKLSVECGYNILMRYKDNKLIIDSKEPNFELYDDYLSNEVRYNSLKLNNKEQAKELLEEQKNNAIKRYEYYKNK